MAPGCQHGRKAKGEWPCSCVLRHPGVIFYSSISKIVWGISVLDIAASWDEAGGTTARVFSQYRFESCYYCMCCYISLSQWSTFLGSALPKDDWSGFSRQHQTGGIIFLLAHFALCKYQSCAFDFLFRQNKLLLLSYLHICRHEHNLVSNIRKSVFTSAFTSENSCSACKKRSG